MSIATNLSVLSTATAVARADLRAIYTWKSWLGGWLVRVVAQVTFFGLVGQLLDSTDTARYLVVGNAVAIVVIQAMMVVASTTWERAAGTLPLLVAAPGPLPLVFVGRSIQWLADGTVCASIAFFCVGSVFGVPMQWPGVLLVVPLILLVGTATYGFGLMLAALVLKAMALRNLVSNVGYLTLMAVTGVQVPVDFWPDWIGAVAQVLPVTHGLAAIRDVVAGESLSGVAQQATLEGLVGVGWLTVALLCFRRLAESGRRDGSIDFS